MKRSQWREDDTHRMTESPIWRKLSIKEDLSSPVWWYVRISWTSDTLTDFVEPSDYLSANTSAKCDGWGAGIDGQKDIFFFTQELEDLLSKAAEWFDKNAPNTDVSFSTRLSTRGAPNTPLKSYGEAKKKYAADYDVASMTDEEFDAWTKMPDSTDDDDGHGNLPHNKNFAFIFTYTRSGHTKETYSVDYRVDNVPDNAGIEEIIDLAIKQLRIKFRNRASKGPFEVQTDKGIWSRGGKVFYDAQGKLYKDVKFRSWEQMEKDEEEEKVGRSKQEQTSLSSHARALREQLSIQL